MARLPMIQMVPTAIIASSRIATREGTLCSRAEREVAGLIGVIMRAPDPLSVSAGIG